MKVNNKNSYVKVIDVFNILPNEFKIVNTGKVCQKLKRKICITILLNYKFPCNWVIWCLLVWYSSFMRYDKKLYSIILLCAEFCKQTSGDIFENYFKEKVYVGMPENGCVSIDRVKYEKSCAMLICFIINL